MGRMNEIKKCYSATSRMSELVSDNYNILLVMSRFGIALGFGEQTVEEVCHRSGVDTPTFLAIVNTMLDPDYRLQPSDGAISVECFLRYLHNSHDYYLQFRLPELRRKLIEAIDCRHGDIAFAVLKFFDEYVAEVRSHLEYEERTLFPYVRALLAGRADKGYSIEKFASQHNQIADRLTELKKILIQYYPSADSYEINGVLFDLFTCEEDLAMHNFVEDQLFVPVVKELETEREKQGERGTAAISEPVREVLSAREKEIIVCVVKGLTNKQIADELFISTHTVITHRRNIASKLQIHSPAGLTIYAIVHKLVDLSEVRETILQREPENEKQEE